MQRNRSGWIDENIIQAGCQEHKGTDLQEYPHFSSKLIIRIKQIKTSFLNVLRANNLLQKSAKSVSSAVQKSSMASPSFDFAPFGSEPSFDTESQDEVQGRRQDGELVKPCGCP